MNRKILIRWASCLVACMGMAAVSFAQAQQAVGVPGNLLENSNFENGTKGWVLHSIAGPEGTMAMDETVKHSNRPSLRVDNAKASDTVVGQKVPVKPNTRYRMTAFIKTKDVTPVKRGGKEGASFAVYGQFLKTESVQGTKVWTRVTHEFNTGGETELEIGPRLGHSGNFVTGTAWYADLSLVELGKAHGK